MHHEFIDKLAFIFIQNKKILVTRSKGKEVWYIPGGKREHEESDEQALVREVMEELSVELITSSIKPYGVFTAQAHGKAEGVMVRMTCYAAEFEGTLRVSNEIEEMDFFEYAQKNRTSQVDFLIFDDLYAKGLIK